MKSALVSFVVVLGFFSCAYAQQTIDISQEIIYEGKSRLHHKTLQQLDSLRIDFQMRGDCYAFSSRKHAKKSNGEAHSSNVPKSNNGKFNSGLIGLYLSKNEHHKIFKNHIGHTLYLINTTENTIDFSAQDSRLNIVTEVKNIYGQWIPITYLPSSSCGNSYHTITLGSNEYWEFVQPIYKGKFKTKLRYSLTTKNHVFISNEIDAYIQLAQLNKKNKQGHTPKNIMDPYKN